MGDDLEEVNARLKEIRVRSQQIRQKTGASKQPLDNSVLSAAAVVFGACEEIEPALRFASAHIKRAMTDDALAILVRDAFARRDLAAFAWDTDSLLLEFTPVLADRIQQYVLEWRTVAWARDQNQTCGVAPSTRQLLDHIAEQGVRNPVVRGRTETGRPNNKSRAWAARFRARWRGRVGAVRIESTMTHKEKCAKACAYVGRGVAMFTVLPGCSSVPDL